MNNFLPTKKLLSWLNIILLFFLAACAGPQKQPQRNIIDNSKPNIPSLYYYISASLQYYAGEFLVADDYYKLALDQDYGSYQIRKQILINSAFAFFNNQQDAQTTVSLYDKARKEIDFDSDLLNVAYSIYSYTNNEEGLAWVIAESVLYYPSTISYLRKFYLEYSKNKKADIQYLELAYKYADHNPEDLILTAKMYSLVNSKRSAAILKEAYILEPKPETDNLLNEIILKYLGKEEAQNKFLAYQYPIDKEQMLSFLLMANQNRQFEIVNSLNNQIFKTGDLALLSELALSAYLADETDILQELSRFLLQINPEPNINSQVAIILFAEALFSDNLQEPIIYTDYFCSASDLQDAIIFAMLKYSMKTKSKEINSEFSADLVLSVQKRLPESVFADYLKIAAKANTVEDQDFLQARANLCNYFLQKNLGELDDWTFLLQYYHQQNRQEEKITLLRKAINIYPDNPLFLNDLGYTLLDFSEHLNEAGLLIQRAVALDPANAYYQDSLAWYYYLTSDFNSALEHINLPMQLKDMPAEISYHIGMILIANQKNEEAIKYLQAVTEDQTNPLYQEKARQALEELQK